MCSDCRSMVLGTAEQAGCELFVSAAVKKMWLE